VRLELRQRTLRLAQPVQTSYGPLAERPLLVVSVTGADGVSGYGEAAPLQVYDGIATELAIAALERHREVLARFRDAAPHGELLAACREVDGLPAALAAVDMALWDRAGRVQRKPVAELLCERPAREVAVNALISALDPREAREQAAAAARDGFGCVKVKVGVGDDGARVAAVRAGAGAAMALRLDANGAWELDEAAEAIAGLAPARIELVEEPVHGVERVRALRARVAVPISIDETAAEPGALAAGAADAVCLKVSRCGGISGLLADAEQARAAGAEVYLASSLDGPLGVAAALHAGAAVAAAGPLRACGLATLGLFAGIVDPLAPRAGVIALPSAPGLGVEPF
jgi:L-alanine-DL-glutamate epimerase-like enolase superfamily enzyme